MAESRRWWCVGGNGWQATGVILQRVVDVEISLTGVREWEETVGPVRLEGLAGQVPRESRLLGREAREDRDVRLENLESINPSFSEGESRSLIAS